MKKKKNKEIDFEIVRYNPDVSIGLNSEQVAERNEHFLTNTVNKGSNKTILNIILKNFFTFFKKSLTISK